MTCFSRYFANDDDDDAADMKRRPISGKQTTHLNFIWSIVKINSDHGNDDDDDDDANN